MRCTHRLFGVSLIMNKQKEGKEQGKGNKYKGRERKKILFDTISSMSVHVFVCNLSKRRKVGKV